MSGEEEDERILVDLGEYLSNRTIDGHVDLSDWIPCDGDRVSMMIRMSRVVEMPTLMTCAVAFREYLGKEVPVFLFQVVQGELTFLIDPLDQLISKSAEIIRSSPIGITGRSERMVPEPPCYFCLQLSGPRLKAVDCIMGPPFDHLNPIQPLRDSRQRDIQDSDFLLSPAEKVPEWFLLYKLTRITPIELIRSRSDLGYPMKAMPGRIRAGIEGRPRGSLIQPLHARGIPDKSSGEKRSYGR